MALLVVVFACFGSLVLSIVINLVSEDISALIRSAAERSIRRYAAKWPPEYAERVEEGCLKDFEDTRGAFHTLKFVVALRWGGRDVGDLAKAPAREDLAGTIESDSNRAVNSASTNSSIVIEVPTGPLTVGPPPSTLHVNLEERLRIADFHRHPAWGSSSSAYSPTQDGPFNGPRPNGGGSSGRK